jgi:hypothetical protein
MTAKLSAHTATSLRSVLGNEEKSDLGREAMKLILALTLLTVTTCANAEETYRNRQGHIVGSSSTAATGVTTYRDAQGHVTGSSSTARTGVTTFRDNQGRFEGTTRRDR